MKQNNYHLYNLIATSICEATTGSGCFRMKKKKNTVSDRILYNKQAQKSS